MIFDIETHKLQIVSTGQVLRPSNVIFLRYPTHMAIYHNKQIKLFKKKDDHSNNYYVTFCHDLGSLDVIKQKLIFIEESEIIIKVILIN